MLPTRRIATSGLTGARRFARLPSHSTSYTARFYSTPANNGNLPLDGFRVLDMTRVLAGVSQVHALFHVTTI